MAEIKFLEGEYVEGIRCKVCGSMSNKRKVLIVENAKHGPLYECLDCEAMFYHPFEPPDYKDVDESEQKEKYDLLQARYNIEFFNDLISTYYPLELIDTSRKYNSFLDVGCGVGWALLYAKYKLNCDYVCGVEPSGYGKVAENIPGVKIYRDYLENCEFSRKFEIIYSSQVIEHIPDPHSFLKKIYDLLEDDGILILITPNNQVVKPGMDLGLVYAAISPNAHVVIYNVKSISMLLESVGFRNYIIESDLSKNDIVVIASKLPQPIKISSNLLKSEDSQILQVVNNSMIYILSKYSENRGETNTYLWGISWRVFKYFVSNGLYKEAISIIQKYNLYSILMEDSQKIMQEISDKINDFLDLADIKYPIFIHGLLFYYGVIELNFYNNFAKARDFFNYSHEIAKVFISRRILIDLETPGIYWSSKFHKFLSLFYLGNKKEAKQGFIEFLLDAYNLYNRGFNINLSAPQSLVSEASKLLKDLLEGHCLIFLDKLIIQSGYFLIKGIVLAYKSEIKAINVEGAQSIIVNNDSFIVFGRYRENPELVVFFNDGFIGKSAIKRDVFLYEVG